MRYVYTKRLPLRPATGHLIRYGRHSFLRALEHGRGRPGAEYWSCRYVSGHRGNGVWYLEICGGAVDLVALDHCRYRLSRQGGVWHIDGWSTRLPIPESLRRDGFEPAERVWP